MPYAFRQLDPAFAEFSRRPRSKTRSAGRKQIRYRAPPSRPVPELANKDNVIPRVEIVAKVIERLPHERPEGIRAVGANVIVRARELRFHQEAVSAPGGKQSFLDDSSHIGVLSPF